MYAMAIFLGAVFEAFILKQKSFFTVSEFANLKTIWYLGGY